VTVNWSGVGALGLALAVMLGAFGAHALRARFDAYATGIWEKAVFYHFIHTVGILVVPVLGRSGAISPEAANRVCWLLAAGVLIFSGTLYTLAISGVRALGAITPVGGTAFFAAWLLLAWELFRAR
jgi:uncharacterized membrane protein YgdD (TMEM256/DUF423 family)